MEFHFELRPLADPSARVSWFTLSDGWFWVTLGDDEVFRVDYQVERYWERVCELAPGVLRPVPYDLVPFVESRREEWAEVESEASWDADLWHLGHRMFSEEVPVPWTLRGWLVDADFTIAWIRAGSETRMTIPGDRFLAAVRDFDARYRAAMHARIAELERDYPEIAAANAFVLGQDAELHATRLEREFAASPPAEDRVRAGAAELRAENTENQVPPAG